MVIFPKEDISVKTLYFNEKKFLKEKAIIDQYSNKIKFKKTLFERNKQDRIKFYKEVNHAWNLLPFFIRKAVIEQGFSIELVKTIEGTNLFSLYRDALGMTNYMSEEIKLAFRKDYTNSQLLLYHEIGHFIDGFLFYLSATPEFINIYNEEKQYSLPAFIAGHDEFYIKSSPSEFYANAFYYYFTMPELLETTYPKTNQFVIKSLNLMKKLSEKYEQADNISKEKICIKNNEKAKGYELFWNRLPQNIKYFFKAAQIKFIYRKQPGCDFKKGEVYYSTPYEFSVGISVCLYVMIKEKIDNLEPNELNTLMCYAIFLPELIETYDKELVEGLKRL